MFVISFEGVSVSVGCSGCIIREVGELCRLYVLFDLSVVGFEKPSMRGFEH